MTARERTQHEISEAFDFVRFLINHPKEIKRVKNNSEINILCKEFPHRMDSNMHKQGRGLTQFTYLSERVFHRV